MGRDAERRVARRRPTHHTGGRAADRRRQSRGREAWWGTPGSVDSSGGRSTHHWGSGRRAPHGTSAHAGTSRSTMPGTPALPSLLRGPGLGLGLELVERLLRSIGHHWLLTVELLLGEVVHNLPHACLTAHAHDAESLTLPIGSVFIELDLEEVRYPKVLDVVLDVLVCCPPSQVPDIELPLPSLLAPAGLAARI